MIHVSTADVSAFADSIETLNNTIADASGDVITAMNKLSNCWSGQASEAVLPFFNSIKTNCIEAQKQIVAEYVKFLRLRVSSGYEQIETANTSLSAAFK